MGNRRFLFDLAGLLIITFFLTGAPVTASVTTIDNSTTIAGAIAAAAPGDTIILEPGIYFENEITIDRNITIRANTSYGHDASDTIIDALYLGRVFFNSAGHTLTIDSLTIQNTLRSYQGGAISNEGTLIVISSTFTRCTVTEDGADYEAKGGAIFNSGTLTVTSSTFTDCSAQNAVYMSTGGAIFNRGTATITSSVFNNCHTGAGSYTLGGGAIANDGGTLRVISSEFNGCSAIIGGAIYHYGGTAAISDSTFTDCTATGNGGAIWAGGSGTVEIDSSHFTGNPSDYSAGHGGAIYADGIPVTITSSTFSDLSAMQGGSIYNNGGSLDISATTFSGMGWAADDGGAIWNSGSLDIATSSFSVRGANMDGGAIENTGTLTITSSAFSGSRAGSYGGAIDSSGPASIASSTFSGCMANVGGAVVGYDLLTITDTTIDTCSASSGGAIRSIGAGAALSLSSSVITGSRATYYGGTIFSSGGSMTITGVTVDNSTAGSDGGGIFASGGTGAIDTSTFSNCSATNNGGAIYSSTPLTITSSTFTGNAATGGVGSAIYSTGSASSVHFSRFYQNLYPVWDVVHSPTSVEAQNNWWGTSDNPGFYTGGYVNENPWLVLGITADPASIDTAGNSAIRTNLTFNSDNLAPGGGYVPDDITNTFAMVSGSGSVSPLTDGTVNGVAQTTFTPLYGETVNISGTVDDQTVYIEIPVAQTAPVPSGITPDTGVNTSGIAITNLAGSSFTIHGTTEVRLTRAGYASITATGVTVVDNTQITCTFPITGAEAGAWDVVVVNPDGQEGVLPGGFMVTIGAPAISGITPNVGLNLTAVSITNLAGSGFLNGLTVRLTRAGHADIAATGVTVVSPAQITCTLPITGAEAGAWNVVVTNPDGQEAMLANGFTITVPVPTPVPTTPAPTAVPTWSPEDTSGTLSDFPSSGFPLMTVVVNIGGDSKAWQAIVTGTNLRDLIVTGTVQSSGAGGNFTVPPGIVFQYISLVPARYDTITNAVINFTVPQSWLDENHIDPKSIVLYRQTANGWEALPTTVLYTKDGMVYFSAVSPGFSLFAIAGTPAVLNSPGVAATKEPVSTPAVLEQVPEPAAVAKAPVTTQTTAPAPAPVKAPAGSSPLPIIPALIGIGCVGLVGGGWYIRRWWIRRQNPALFEEY